MISANSFPWRGSIEIHLFSMQPRFEMSKPRLSPARMGSARHRWRQNVAFRCESDWIFVLLSLEDMVFSASRSTFLIWQTNSHKMLAKSSLSLSNLFRLHSILFLDSRTIASRLLCILRCLLYSFFSLLPLSSRFQEQRSSLR
jgi:hypothetical protein